ncbi:hypothetical protein MKX01_029002, partial [Papaver californicum]
YIIFGQLWLRFGLVLQIAYRNAETVISWNTKASDRDINGNETGTFSTATGVYNLITFVQQESRL